MAIVEMKRIMLLALNEDKAKVLSSMQRMGCIEVTPLSKAEAGDYVNHKAPNDAMTNENISRLTWTIAKLGKYNIQKTPMFGKRPEIDRAKEEDILGRESELMDVVSAAEALERESGEVTGQKARLQAALEQLQPWLNLDIPFGKVDTSRDTFQIMGQLPKKALESIQAFIQDKPAYFNPISQVADNIYFWAIGHKSVSEAFLGELKKEAYVPAKFEEMTLSSKAQSDIYIAQMEECETQNHSIQERYKALSAYLTDLKILYDMLLLKQERNNAYLKAVTTETCFILKGWAPAKLCDKIKAGLEKMSPTCQFEIVEPEEGEEQPVALHNNPIVAPFETIVTGFALPSPTGIDPTAVMAPFYACLFGMMVSDAGYGLVMGIAIPLFIWLYKPAKSSQKMMWLLTIGGWFTVFWGFVYNTWFGAQLPYQMIDPLKDSMMVMVISIGFGAVHLFAGLGMAAYMNIKRGDPWAAVFDQLSWFMIIVGLAVMVIVPSLSTVGQYVAIAGAGIILLTAGRANKNPFKRLMSGLGALYGISSWVSDLLSYMRLFGMGLATGVIGMVINQLVGMVFNAGIIGKIIGAVLFVGAHCFNAGINILGAYVHSCRLQYIEFFGKFYEEGGRPFKPLRVDTRYVNLQQTTEI